MPKSFDASLKDLVEKYPADWARYLGVPAAGRVEVIDADLATVTASADKVLRIGEGSPWILHLEFQASHDQGLARRVLRYNVLLNGRHDLPVRSVVLLLQPRAYRPDVSGVVREQLPGGRQYLEFFYEVIRLWEEPVERILAGGLGMVPLAPLSRVAVGELPGVIRRMEERINQEVSGEEAKTLWARTFLLMGLRYPRDFAARLLEGVGAMEESDTYQAVVDEGRVKEAKKLLLLQGRKRFGTPDEQTRAAVEGIADLSRLENLSERLLDVTSWEELLATP